MKQIFKTIAFGIALGATLFFVPIIFKFILSVIVVGLFFKMVFGRRRRRFTDGFTPFNPQYSPIVPIDNQWYKPNIHGNGPVNHININY